MPGLPDQWLASRRFGLVIDAGSSGSRLQIYSWKDARGIKYSAQPDDPALESLPRVEKGTQTGDDWVYKVEPGISTLGASPNDVGAYLQPMLSHAMDNIPPSLHRDTPIFLLATAGMRLLPQAQQTALIDTTCKFLRTHSDFRLDPASDQGPCGASVRIITGEEEGLFGWIAVNYLMNGFTGHEQHHRATFGFLDMGGASTQIAFEPSASERDKMSPKTVNNLAEVRLRLLGGEEISHRVFVSTWLGYGTNQARERYVGQELDAWETSRPPDMSEQDVIPDPCLPRDLSLVETPVVVDPSSENSHSRKPHSFIGTGSFPQCLKQTAPLLNKSAPCPEETCLFNGTPAPSIDFTLSKFIGVSEYWYSSEHVFGLGGAYDFVQYERAATEFCSRDWDDIVQEHNSTRHDVVTGSTDGDGALAPKHRWGAEVGIGRLRMQCFKAAWIVNMLHEGFGMPRITDSGGNSTKSEVDKAGDLALNKGLGAVSGPPAFQSVDSIGDVAISWTLGKMVLEASKEVPPASASTPPLMDPSPNPHHHPNPPVSSKPSLGDRLRSSLETRLASPAFIAIYVLIAILCALFAYRLRRRRSSLSGYSRPRRRRASEGEDGVALFDYFTSEESGGTYSSSSSPPDSPTGSMFPSMNVVQPSRLLRVLGRTVRRLRYGPRPRSRRKPEMTVITNRRLASDVRRPTLRQTRTAPTISVRSPPGSPTLQHQRSSSPVTTYLRSTTTTPPSSTSSSRIHSSLSMTRANITSRPQTPRASDSEDDFDYDDADDEWDGNRTARPRSSLGASPYGNLSRNSSQINLTTLIPRAASASRLGLHDNIV